MSNPASAPISGAPIALRITMNNARPSRVDTWVEVVSIGGAVRGERAEVDKGSLTHVYNKFGLTSRVQLMREAARPFSRQRQRTSVRHLHVGSAAFACHGRFLLISGFLEVGARGDDVIVGSPPCHTTPEPEACDGSYQELKRFEAWSA